MRRFVECAQNEIAVVPDFHKRILFSDGVHFWLNSYVNKQNCRIWSEANPQVYVETPLHPEKLTVWCALWAGGIIGPYFFKNDEGHNVTVNGDRYRAIIDNFFIPELNNHDVQELWFQQDGATCHTARATIDLLKDTFGDRLISRFGPVNWPPRSCDLTPLDYFLWGHVKSLFYADKPQTLDHLEDNIRRVIADIRPQMLEKVIENGTSRLDYIRASRGSPMPETIFKIEIGRLVRRNQATVMRVCYGWRQKETTVRHGQIHLICLHHYTCDDRRIVRMAVLDHAATLRTIAQHILSVTHHSVFAGTIRHHLQLSGISARCLLSHLLFTGDHKRFRHQW
ncbi:putative transposable element [Trichonephila clavipes]|nr:putative transposable element [Trichonephila clavipes]